MKTCCTNCVKIPELLDELNKRGYFGDCNVCESKEVLTIKVNEIRDQVRELINNIWNDTCYRVKHINRFFYTELFEKILSSSIIKAEDIIPDNSVLFRARLEGPVDDFGNILGPYPPSEMGAPTSVNSRNGRANVRGISSLYTASSMRTAVAEVRPWKDAFVTVARVITNSNLEVINLVYVLQKFKEINFNLTLNELLDYTLLLLIGLDLSKPVSTMDKSEIEYIPTQIFTDFIKYKGYDGMIYKSSLGEDNNIVIFEEEKVTIIDSQLHRVNNIIYEID